MKLLNKVFLLAVIVISFSSCDKQDIIVNSILEREANEIVVFLADHNIKAFKSRDLESGSKESLWNISVSSSERLEAMSCLSSVGLPRKKGQTLLQLFAKGGLVSSESEELIRYRAGLAAEMENTIRQIDGVIDAHIQLSFPETSSFGMEANKGQATASVFIKHLGILDDPNAHLTTKIKRLIASSINGLTFENVTVISDRARIYGFTKNNLPEKSLAEEKDFVRVWSIIVDKDSVSRFRIIFSIFSILIVVLTLSLAVIAWKVFPVINKHGGISKLLKHSLETEDFAGVKPEKIKKNPETEKVSEKESVKSEIAKEEENDNYDEDLEEED